MKKLMGVALCIGMLLFVAFAVNVSAEESIVIDGVPGNGSYFEEHLTGTGSTWANTASSGYYLEGSYGRNLNGANTGSATWKTNVPEAGFYKVEYVHVKATLTHEVVVKHNNKEETVTIPGGGSTSVWFELGTFYFNGNETEAVVAQRTTAGSGANFRVDAVRLTPVDYIIDGVPGNGSYFEEHLTGTGSTWTNTASAGYYLAGSFGRNMSGANTGSATWKTNVPEAGFYKVEYVHVKSTLAHAVVIKHNNKEESVDIAKGGSTSEWLDLGTFYFSGGETEAVVAQRTTAGSGANFRVDAIRLTPIEYYVIDGVPDNGSYFEEHLTGSGSIWASTTSAGYFLEGSYGRNLNGANTGSATWKTNVPEAGFYKVEYAHVKATLAHEVVIKHNNKEETVNIPGGGATTEWVELGTFYFNGNETEAVVAKRTEAGSGANLRVDAIRYKKVKAEGVLQFETVSGKVENGKVSVSASVNNEKQASGIVVAGFYKDDEMVDVDYSAERTLKKGLEVYTFESTETDIDQIKIFVWESMTSMVPMLQQYELTVINGVVSPVAKASDFGAVGDGVTNDGPALARAFSSIQNGGVLKLDPGKNYFVATKDGIPSYFVLDGYKNATIDGQGATLTFTRGNTPFLLQNCENVTLKNLKVDYNEATYFQGQIVAVDSENYSIDVLLEDGFLPAPLGTGTQVSGGGGLHGMIFDTETKARRITGGHLDHFKASEIEEVDADTFRFTFSESYRDQFEGIFVGDTVTYGMGKNLPSPAGDSGKLAAGAVLVTKSSDITFKNVSLYRSLIMGYVVYDNVGDVTFDNIRIEPKPGTTGMLSTCSDGIHAKNNRGSVNIQNSYIEACGDDLISVSTKDEAIKEMIDTKTFVLQSTEIVYYFYAIQEGDTLQFVDKENGKVLGTAEVISAQADASKRTHQVVLDAEIPGLSDYDSFENIRVINQSATSGGTEITGNTLVPVFRHAMLLRLNDAQILNNKVQSKGSTIGIRVQDEAGVGPFSENVIISGNEVNGTYLSGITVGKTMGNAEQNIQLENNKIKPSAGKGIRLEFAHKIIMDNNFITMNAVQNGMPAVQIENSADVDLGRLTITDTRQNRPHWLDSDGSGVKAENVIVQP